MCPVGGSRLYPKSEGLLAGKMVCHCLVVEHNNGLVLVDTGVGTRDIEQKDWPWALKRFGKPRLEKSETIVQQIASLGLNIEDVRDILITHLDLDHAGGLMDLPHARVHVHELEREAAFTPSTAMARRRYLPQQWAHDVRWQTHSKMGERWFGFEGVRPVPGCSDEILLIPLIGHTKGHCGVAVNGPDGWLLHCGDAYYHRDQLLEGEKAPMSVRMFQRSTDTIRSERIRNVRRLGALQREHEAEVRLFSAHDPVEFAELAPGPLP